jgi:hypothetical protein
LTSIPGNVKIVFSIGTLELKTILKSGMPKECLGWPIIREIKSYCKRSKRLKKISSSNARLAAYGVLNTANV